jgi:PTH1 family peptidyl-tRNA hydrolase
MSVFRRAAERRGVPADLLVVGLGNPGPEFAGTRHNQGADVCELLAERWGVALGRERRAKAATAVATVGGKRVVLAVPTTYMNLSGEAVAPLVRRHGIDDPSRLLVVHDELDLEPGRLRVKVGGGLAGNNGLRSISAHLGTNDFARVRIGIGKPPSAAGGAGYVLKPPPKAEREVLADARARAADAVETYLLDGAEAAMSRFNGR